MKIKNINPMRFTLVMLFAGIFLIAAGAATAQTEQAAPEQAPQKISDFQPNYCQPGISILFNSGSGASKLAFCISYHGNLLNLESPETFKQIASKEGYAVCSSAGVHGYDVGSVESGWDVPTTSFNDPNAFAVSRATTDGKLRLGQRFTWDATKKQVTIEMQLRNLTEAPISGVKLVRYFDADVSGDSNDDRYDADADSVWARDDGTGAGHHGLLLTALPYAGIVEPHNAVVEKYTDFNPAGAAQTATTCTPIAQTAPTAPGDYTGRLTFNLGTINAGATKYVRVIYNRF
jgi:hypothetical protein